MMVRRRSRVAFNKRQRSSLEYVVIGGKVKRTRNNSPNPWKVNGVRTESKGGEKHSDYRRRTHAEEDTRELYA